MGTTLTRLFLVVNPEPLVTVMTRLARSIFGHLSVRSSPRLIPVDTAQVTSSRKSRSEMHPSSVLKSSLVKNVGTSSGDFGFPNCRNGLLEICPRLQSV